MPARQKTKILLFSASIISSALISQAHNVSEGYLKPTDPLVARNLEQWQDLKFGLFMHWGTYSQWGVVESWSLCPEDESWTQRNPEHGKSYYEYVKNYENLQTTFNPTQFDPAKWAEAAKKAGMKYVVFTTSIMTALRCLIPSNQTIKSLLQKHLFRKIQGQM